MSLPEIKIHLIAKIQNTNDQILLNQISEWMDGIGGSLVLPLNEIQKLKIEKSRQDIKQGKFKTQVELFTKFRNAYGNNLVSTGRR